MYGERTDAWILGEESGEDMAETVVQIPTHAENERFELCKALDAFAQASMESGAANDTDDAPPIMMKTDYSADGEFRKLVFGTREQAARFLSFWRAERKRTNHPA